MRKDIMNETMKLLNEETQDQTVVLGNVKGRVYGQDELDCFNAMKNTVKGLEQYVAGFYIMLDQGLQNASITFQTKDGKNEFEVFFDTESFGKVTKVQTTFSNQDITQEFLTLAQELYNLYK